MAWIAVNPPFVKFKKEVFTKAAKVASFIYQIGGYEDLILQSDPKFYENAKFEKVA